MYRLHHLLGVIIVATGEHIRPLRSSAKWRDYLNWIRAGNVPLPPIIPEPEPDPNGVPQVVGMDQFRLALLDSGLLDAIQTRIEALPLATRKRLLIRWEYATLVRRDSPIALWLIAQAVVTEAQMDALFVAAAGL